MTHRSTAVGRIWKDLIIPEVLRLFIKDDLSFLPLLIFQKFQFLAWPVLAFKKPGKKTSHLMHKRRDLGKVLL